MPLRKLSKCHQNVVKLIHKVAKILCFHNYQYVIKTGCEDIDSFYAGYFTVQITGIKYGRKITQIIIIKHHPDSQARTVFRELYRRETTFYQKVLPRYLEIQQKFSIIEGLRMKFPNCILASDELNSEAVVIMGILSKEFKNHNRFEEMDFNHATLMLKNLAKLHGLSFILEHVYPKIFEDVKELCYKDVQYSSPDRQSRPMRQFFDASVRVISDPIAKQKLTDLSPKIFSLLHKSTLPVPHSTLCHGDCWNNNIFFKYQNKRPVDLLLVDYQLMRYASPVTDISYFFYMSTPKAFLSKHYESALNIYYGTLAGILQECHLKVEEIYPKKIFESQLREYSVLGLIEALISMMIITSPFEDALRMTEIKNNCNDGFCESSNNTLFKQRVNDIVDVFFEKNYSLDAVLDT